MKCVSAACSIVALSSCMAGCADDSWQLVTDAVWSDDGSEALVIVSRVEDVYRPYDHDHARTLDHQIWRYDVNSEAARLWLDDEPGPAGAPFFMRSAGFVVLSRDGEAVRLDLDGRARSLGYSGYAAPSPDGRIVALLAGECARTDSPVIDACSGHFRFFDAETGAELAPSGDFQYDVEIDAPRPWTWTWDPDSTRVWARRINPGIIEAFGPTYVLRPGEEPEEVTAPPCAPLGPPTSSSDLRPDGTKIKARWEDGSVVVEIEPWHELGWPDRCFPPG